MKTITALPRAALLGLYDDDDDTDNNADDDTDFYADADTVIDKGDDIVNDAGDDIVDDTYNNALNRYRTPTPTK